MPSLTKLACTLTRSRFNYLLCLIAGGLLTLGFAPFGQHWLGVVAPLLLFACWQHASPKKALLQGWLFGLGLFGSGASWIYVSIATYGNTNVAISLLVTLLFVAVLALFTGVNGWLVNRLFRREHNTIWRLLWIYPLSWVLFEWLRSWLFTGFPWLYVGYSQLHWPLGWFAPIGSVYLVSWLTLVSAACVLLLLQRVMIWKALLILIVLWCGGWGLSYVHWSKPAGAPLKAALIQGNVSQGVKWSPQYLTQIIDTYTQLTQANWQPLVIWPESALPVFAQNIPDYLPSLDAAAQSQHSAVLVGMPIYHEKTGQYFNGAVVKGDGSGTYLKRHLVPFGEYVPFNSIVGKLFQFMHIPMSNFSSGPDRQALLQMQGYPVALFICYESAFPQEVRAHLGKAAWLVTISDDAWFGHSVGPLQQEQMAAMRALETSRYELRATNNGVTSIINNQGYIIAQAPQFIRTVLTGSITPMQGTTPWVRIGLWPWLLLWFFILIIRYAILRINTTKPGKPQCTDASSP